MDRTHERRIELLAFDPSDDVRESVADQVPAIGVGSRSDESCELACRVRVDDVASGVFEFAARSPRRGAPPGGVVEKPVEPPRPRAWGGGLTDLGWLDQRSQLLHRDGNKPAVKQRLAIGFIKRIERL